MVLDMVLFFPTILESKLEPKVVVLLKLLKWSFSGSHESLTIVVFGKVLLAAFFRLNVSPNAIVFEKLLFFP